MEELFEDVDEDGEDCRRNKEMARQKKLTNVDAQLRVLKKRGRR